MYSNKWEGQVAIVTGAGQGIGLEIAKRLAGKGVAVVLNDLDAKMAEDSAAIIVKDGGRCIAFGGDSSDPETVQAMVDLAAKTFGKLTMAIANAGITLFGSFLNYPASDLRRVLEVNCLGSFLLAQAAARQMKLQEEGGRILFMSSVVGHQAHENLGAYAMTKAALEMLAKNLVIELSPYRITINAVAPGATLTERTLTDDPTYTEVWSGITPLGRPAYVQDIANAVLFFMAPESGHVTGQSLVVDGGWTSVSPLPDLRNMKEQ
jgi:NAD(P)-dependent dehydrogenase (short-subunit alcohol dehydrogenase family)